jgi:hypothetical protein
MELCYDDTELPAVRLLRTVYMWTYIFSAYSSCIESKKIA